MADQRKDLEAVFGGPGDEAFGSAVFRRPLSSGEDLAPVARDVYREFVGELWERFGADTWLGAWALAASRDDGAAGSVIDLLAALEDPLTRSAADMLVNAGPDPAAARAALVEAFDRPGVTGLTVFSIGDGAAMSGVMVAAAHREAAEAVFVVFLMD